MSGPAVVTLVELVPGDAERLVARYGARLVRVPDGAAIPASYWGAPEAGVTATALYARADTPAHSLLHELAHYVCATPARRAELERDAGGDTAEECAVCCLEVALADALGGFGRERCLADMDAWGYSFREGSAAAWLAGDGADAHAWLERHGLVDAAGRPTWRLRGVHSAIMARPTRGVRPCEASPEPS